MTSPRQKKKKRGKTVKQGIKNIYASNERRIQDALLRAALLINPTPQPQEECVEGVAPVESSLSYYE